MDFDFETALRVQKPSRCAYIAMGAAGAVRVASNLA